MAQTLKSMRDSYFRPAAVGMIIMAVFLFLAKKIDNACVIVCLVACLLLFLMADPLEGAGNNMLDDSTRGNETAIAISQASLNLLEAEREKTKRARKEFWINVLKVVGGALAILAPLLSLYFKH